MQQSTIYHTIVHDPPLELISLQCRRRYRSWKMASSSSSSLPERLTALLPNPVPRSGVAADTASPQAPGANGAPRSLHAPPGSTAAAAVAAPPRVVPPTLPLSSSSSSSVAAQPSSSGSSGGASTASALWTTAAAASAAAASAAGATGAASVFDVLVVSKFAASLRPTFDHVLQSVRRACLFVTCGRGCYTRLVMCSFASHGNCVVVCRSSCPLCRRWRRWPG